MAFVSRRSAIRGAERYARGREKWREKTGKPGIRKSRKGNFISLSLFSYTTLFITKKVVTVPSLGNLLYNPQFVCDIPKERLFVAVKSPARNADCIKPFKWMLFAVDAVEEYRFP